MTFNHSQRNSTPPAMRVVIIGGARVGKSLLAAQFVDPHSLPDQNVDNSVEETYKKKCKVDGELVTLEIIDTPGLEQYSVMRQHHMRLGHGFLLVFSLQDRSSFEDVLDLHSSILTFKDRPYFPMVLLGNNNASDLDKNKTKDILVSDESNMDKKDAETDAFFDKQVSSEEGLEMSRKLGLSYIETCVKSGMNVELAFHELVRTIRYFWTVERKPIEEKNKKRKLFCFR